MNKVRFSKIICYAICAVSLIFFSQKSEAQNPIWTVGTAITVPKNTLEISLFRPARYGLTRHIELDLHPIDFFVMPHLYAKKMWALKTVFHRKFFVSSLHGIYYPTYQLKLADRFGPSNLFPEQTTFSRIFAFRNELIISHFLVEPTHCNAGNNLLTFRLGFKYSVTSSEKQRPVIERPILFRETMVFYPKPVWYAGFDIDAVLNATFNYFADLEFHSVGIACDYWALEGKAGIMGYSGRNLSACIGVKFAFSTLPGISKFYMIPLADVSYTFKVKQSKRKQKGLFGGKEGFEYESFDLKGDIQYRKRMQDSTKINNYNPNGR